MSPLLVAVVFVLSAALEVGGDALIRRGLHSHGTWLIAVGFLVLGGYGLLVNTLDWDFSRLLGVYVAVFAVLSILCGRFLFQEVIPTATWVGLALIVLGGLTIQVGQRSWH